MPAKPCNLIGIVSCNQMEINNADGEEASLMNGMACQAKVIVDEETVMPFLLKKMNLMD